MKLKLYYLMCFGSSLFSCVSEVPLSFPKETQKIVIEALLTDELIEVDVDSYSPAGTSKYVRVTYSDPKNEIKENEYNIRPVRNAQVFVRDDLGQIDTLKADSAKWEPFRGYYTSQKLQGKAGRTYFLDVWVGEDHFSSTTYMPPVVMIDSVSVVYIKRPIEKFSGYGPLLYFKNNKLTKNYYITKINQSSRNTSGELRASNFNYGLSDRIWNYSVLSTEILPEYVKGLSIPLGVTSSTYFVESLHPGETYDACLFSLTKEAYDYYSALGSSLKNDGGAYSPTPASPPSNIKGGALGFFNASAASARQFKVPSF